MLEPHFRTLLVVLVVGHALLQLPLAATFLVPLVPAKHSCRLLCLDVRERRDVVRAVHHYCRRSDTRFPPIVVAGISSDMGRHLDLHRDARNFYFAVPSFHSIPADDRHVRNKNCCARGGPALWRGPRHSIRFSWRKGAHTMIKT